MEKNPIVSRLLSRRRGLSLLARLRQPLWLVGGSVRDLKLGLGPRDPLDIDLACRGAKALARRLARGLGGTAFPLDESAGVYRVALKGTPALQIDLAEIQGPGILADLGRRDFTVNAMALPLDGGKLLDPFGGLGDLLAKKLRAVSKRIFDEDPLRLLRLFRLSAQLGFSLDAGTLALAGRKRALAARPAAERVRGELLLLLESKGSARLLGEMDEAGLLTAVFPEMEPCRRCAEVYYGKGGVLKHSLDAALRMELLLENLGAVLGALAGPIRENLASLPCGQDALLKLCAFLHDVAKPPCAKRLGGRLRFFEHDARGAEMIARLLTRLRFSGEEVREARALVAHHLRPGNLAAARLVTDKAVFRFFRDLGGFGVPLLLLCWADHASYLDSKSLAHVLPYAGEDPHHFRKKIKPEATAKTLHHLQVVAFLLRQYFTRPQTARPKPLLDGHQVMRTLRIKPGPEVGKILAGLQEAQATGKVKTRAQALKFLRGGRAAAAPRARASSQKPPSYPARLPTEKPEAPKLIHRTPPGGVRWISPCLQKPPRD